MSTAFDIDGLPTVRAGVARGNITPPPGSCLAGYFHERVAAWRRDSLFCHVVVLQRDAFCVALVSCDLICFDVGLANRVKAAIERRAGIGPNHVLLHATHTHTGPVLGNICRLPIDDAYVKALPDRIAGIVNRAVQSLFDAIVFAGSRSEDRLGSNRLGRKRDGSEVFSKADVIGPAGPVDPEVLALGIRDMAGRVRGVVINYAMHPDVVGGGGADFFSADWPGEIGRALAGVYGPETVTVFLNGPCGDLNHTRWNPTRLPTGRAAKSVQMGRVLAGNAMAAFETAEPLSVSRCGANVDWLDLPFFTRDAAFEAEMDALEAKPDEEREGWERVLLMMNEGWDKDGQVARVPVQVLRIGDLMIVGLPAEVFTAWGLEIKHWSPTPFTAVVELANGWFGYIPTTDQAHRGAYGAKPILSRQLVSDAGRQLADAAQRLMWTLWES